MYFSSGILLVICAITQTAVAKPTADSSLETQAQSTAESSTRSLQNGVTEGFSQAESSAQSIQDGVGDNQGFSQAQSTSRSIQNGAGGQSVSEAQSFASSDVDSQLGGGGGIGGGDRFQNMFRFVHDQQISGEEEFDQLLRKMNSIIEQEYSQAVQELKKWNQIEELAQHERKAETGLALAKEQLEEIISESADELRTGLRGCNKEGGGENYQQKVWELRQRFESEIKEYLIYFIQALKGINSLDFGSSFGGQKSSRCIGGGSGGRKKRLAARSFGSGIFEAGKGMVGQAVGAGKEMVNSGIEMGGDMVNSATNLKTGMAKKATDFGGDMINEASSTASSMAESGIGMGGEMFNSARGIGEGMAATATGFAGGMGGGPKKGGKCQRGGGSGGPRQGGHGHGQGVGQEGGYGVESSGQAASAASAGTTQEFRNDGDDYYSSTSSSARSYAGAESGTESKSLSI